MYDTFSLFWISFASTLLGILASVFIKDIGIYTYIHIYILASLTDFGIRVIKINFGMFPPI